MARARSNDVSAAAECPVWSWIAPITWWLWAKSPSNRVTARDVADTVKVVATRAALERLQEVLS